MSAAIDRVRYMSSGTQTDAALDAMTTYGFSEQSGAHPKSEGHPRIGIILTDGGSRNPSLTALAAQRVHDAGITMISVGIGSWADPQESEVYTDISFTAVARRMVWIGGGGAPIVFHRRRRRL